MALLAVWLLGLAALAPAELAALGDGPIGMAPGEGPWDADVAEFGLPLRSLLPLGADLLTERRPAEVGEVRPESRDGSTVTGQRLPTDVEDQLRGVRVEQRPIHDTAD